jgi:PilZ domain
LNIEKAFPRCLAKVYRVNEDTDADTYNVMQVRGTRLCLEAKPEMLTQPVPHAGEMIFILSLRPDAAYEMEAKVVDCLDVTKQVCVIVEQSGEIKRIQRRRFFRIPTSFKVEVTVEGRDETPQSLETRDLSAGGCSILATASIENGEILGLSLDLDDGNPPLVCKGKVCRCRPLEKGLFDWGIAFHDLTEQDTDRMVPVLLELARNKVNL